jgi:hypothetical protein
VLDDILGGAARVSPAPRAAWAAGAASHDARSFVFARPLSPGQAWARAYPRPAAVGAPPSPPPVPRVDARHMDVPLDQVRVAPLAEPVSGPEPIATTPAPSPAAHEAPRPAAESARTASAKPAADPSLRPASPRVVRPPTILRGRRPLTMAERRALDRLLLLGARLDDQFSADDLRREYRKLALRLHPDRHAQAPAGDRAALAEAFARATASYRCLQAVHGAKA